MKELSRIASAVQASTTMAIDAMFKQMKADGVDVIGFGAGEPDFNTPDNIKAAGIAAIEQNITRYTPAAGTVELRQAVCGRMKADYGLEYKPSQVVVSSGAKHLVYLALRAVVNPGDEVILPAPYWVSYIELIKMVGGVPVVVTATEAEHFKLTAEKLSAAITPRTKVLVLPFPNNPTGGIMSREDLEAIAQVLRGTDIMVISDEIYAELTYGQHHVSIANIPDMYERTIVVNGFSKSHAMTGWRMGYLCGPAPLIKQMLKLHQFGIMSAPTTSQYAAIEAMRNGDRDIEKMRDEYDGRRRYLVEGLRRIGLPCFEPKGAFYVFPDIRGTGLSSEDFCERFLMEEKVAVIAGNAFGAGGEGFVRCCYATSMKDIAEALTRMDNFLTNLKKKQAREREE